MSMPSATTVRLSDETKAQVDKFAKLTRRSRSFVIQEAVETYIQEHIEYLEGINEALEDIKTGYGHSSEQISVWMKSWGTENELPTPKPDIIPKNS